MNDLAREALDLELGAYVRGPRNMSLSELLGGWAVLVFYPNWQPGEPALLAA